MTTPATMSANPEAQQVFSWTLQLSAQKDYQALTHHFLEMLLKMAQTV